MQVVQNSYEDFAERGHTGRLKDRAAIDLIWELSSKKFTGKLELQHREKRKKIYFLRGEPVKTISNLGPELFGSMLLERGWITESDLQTALESQRSKSQRIRIGEILAQQKKIERSMLDDLYEQQRIFSIVQAMSWEDGQFEIIPKKVPETEARPLSFQHIYHSVLELFETGSGLRGQLFRAVPPIAPLSKAQELSRVPLWLMLAACRVRESSGIISIRKQHQLIEIVIKGGIPLTLYEGTFSRPRQTVVIRQASVQHEQYFKDQLLKFFSFLSGVVYFRQIGEVVSYSEEASEVRSTEETRVFLEAARGAVVGSRLRSTWMTMLLWLDQMGEELKVKLVRAKNSIWKRLQSVL